MATARDARAGPGGASWTIGAKRVRLSGAKPALAGGCAEAGGFEASEVRGCVAVGEDAA